MRTFPIAHYRKDDSAMLINGGKLIVTETEYIVKYVFKTVAVFPIAQTTVKQAPPVQLYEGITLTHEQTEIHVYFLPQTTKTIRSLIDEIQSSMV